MRWEDSQLSKRWAIKTDTITGGTSIQARNILFVMDFSLPASAAAALGYLLPIGGAIAQEFIDLIAILNAVRVAVPFSSALQDF